MLVPFRLYFKVTCAHCKKAMEKLASAEVPFQCIEVGEDPIVNSGLQQFNGAIPVLVCFANREVIIGYKEEDFARVIAIYKTGLEDNTLRGTNSESFNAVVN